MPDLNANTSQQQQSTVSSVQNSAAAQQQEHQHQQNEQNQLQQTPASSAGMSISCMPPLQHLEGSSGLSNMTSVQSLSSEQHPQHISTADWASGRVQFIQQPLQNPTYLQPIYNAQGQILVPSNIALHPGINSPHIQVVAAGNHLQGTHLAPHMLTAAQQKQVIQTGQTSSFPGYTTIPSSQNVVLSPLNMLNSQQNIQAQSEMNSGIQEQAKVGEIHKAEGQTVQFAPWQLPQMWTGSIPTSQFLTPNSILIRGTGQSDGTTQNLYIQHPSQTITSSAQPTMNQNATIDMSNDVHTMQQPIMTTMPPSPKTQESINNMGTPKGPRFLYNILPLGNIRPTNTIVANSASTQTSGNQIQNQGMRQERTRTKSAIRPACPPSSPMKSISNKPQTYKPAPAAVKPQMVVINSAGIMTTIPDTSGNDNTQMNNKSLPQLQQQQQQNIMHQQTMQIHHPNQLSQHYQLQNQNQQLLYKPIFGVSTMPTIQQGMSVQGSMSQPTSIVHQMNTPPSYTAVNHLAATGQNNSLDSSQQIVSNQSVVSAQAINQNMLQVHNATLAPINQLTSVDALQTNSMTGLAQLNALAQNQHQTLEQLNANSIQLQQSFLQPQQHPSLQNQNSILSSIEFQAPHPQTQSQQQLSQTPTQEAQSDLTENKLLESKSLLTENPTTEKMNSLKENTSSTAENNVIFINPTAPINELLQSESTNQNTTTDSQKEIIQENKVNSISNQTSTANIDQRVPLSVNVVGKTKNNPPQPLPIKNNTDVEPKTSNVQIQPKSSLKAKNKILSDVPSDDDTQESVPTLPKNVQMKRFPLKNKTIPQAKVQPNILTHVIDGFVIQEGSKPFGISKALRNRKPGKVDEKTDKVNVTDHNALNTPKNKEEQNSKMSLPKSKGSRNVISLTSKLMNLSSPSAAGSVTNSPRPPEGSKSAVDDTETVTTSTPLSANEEAIKLWLTVKAWTVSEVCTFIRNIPGCEIYADDFAQQEIDGEALLLIKPEHLDMAMKIKLGPALKIIAAVDVLRPKAKESNTPAEESERRDETTPPKKIKYV